MLGFVCICFWAWVTTKKAILFVYLLQKFYQTQRLFFIRNCDLLKILLNLFTQKFLKGANSVVKKKVSKAIIICLLAWAAGSAACKKRPVLEPPVNKIAGISGNWTLSIVEQVDVNNKLGNIKSDTVMDVTSLYLGSKTPMKMTVQSNGNYSITAGVASQYFPKTTGTWKFDNNEYPSMVILDAGTAEEMKYPLIAPTRPQDSYLALKATKICNGKRTVSYNFYFKRA